ncbi:MBL fold metallo-hydrolase [Alysiella crassa]|uniref:Metal-dependent hydrolase n=1 Tax=Alysiella crassa TaxID=153491 RepID=A0A376BVJ3_9NEIS|nr:MBL fold metallo-hydrolase [Alysiella crassa]UOP06475.1 MBL fold metallo-hydrolase [Alysiella crassa]SSY81007.1 metal-dependent hydrolase [Alysiella crassa]
MKLKHIALASLLFAGSLNAWAADSYQHIRNATAKIEYAGQTFLVDPFFAKKGSMAGFEGTFNSHLRSPLVDLPMSEREIVKGVDAVIVTHTHEDHWDKAAQNAIPKHLPIFTQHEDDAQLIRSQGFKNVQVINGKAIFNGVELHKTGGSHGTVEMYANPTFAKILGEAMGVVIKKDGHATAYIVGDTVWTADVNKALHKFNPDYLIMNTGYARINGIAESIIMGTNDVLKATQIAPKAKIITVHMDTTNHNSVSREDMRKFVIGEKIQDKVIIPKDGEIIDLKK